MDWQERRREAEGDGDGHEEEFAGVAGEEKFKGFADVVVDAATFLDGGDDGREVVVGDDHVGGLFGDFGAGDSHGDADVGAFDGGGIVDAVAGHGDDGVVFFKGADDAEFMSGGDAGVDGNFADSLGQNFVGHRVQLQAGDGWFTGTDAEFLGDGGRGMGVISGDHDDANAGGMASGDGGFGFRAGRIIHARQADEDEILLDGFSGKAFGGRGIEVAVGGAEDAEGLSSHGRDLGKNLLAVGIGEGLDAGGGVELRAAFEQRIRRAVDEGTELLVRQLADYGATFAVGVEGDFVALREFAIEAIEVAAGFNSGAEEGNFGGVTDDGWREAGVVAAEEDGGQFAERF